ncbi:methyltransferase family protein [Undibacter mobilis]|uniref:Isoprenylcysteine carboxylmethyltransferase family protein n=1 Tax=Undibacter mobilis TaxID=2292256 RepID=A0A371BDU7_9BRAD|nr:isoprenylcysteine carboxylmethyltransferase family protein [Undibacter mobilis]RDV05583.1 isoprenylcysteine carboxylmethyltransferase family protein [Undibacter mobilis]
MSTVRDNPGVIAPPPLIALAVLVAGLLLDWLLPAYLLSVLLSWGTRILLGLELIGGGAALIVIAMRAFRAAGTHVEPWKPSTALVAGGLYAYVRNPIYVGMILILAGLAVLLASDWMLVLTIVVFIPAIHFGVVLREERYLAAKFGAPYRGYLQKVPRYGWPF